MSAKRLKISFGPGPRSGPAIMRARARTHARRCLNLLASSIQFTGKFSINNINSSTCSEVIILNQQGPCLCEVGCRPADKAQRKLTNCARIRISPGIFSTRGQLLVEPQLKQSAILIGRAPSRAAAPQPLPPTAKCNERKTIR